TTIALSVGVVALTILGTWRTVAGMYVGTALIALSQTFLFPALFVLAVDRAPDDERSHAIGSFSMAFDLAFAAGGAFIGLIADATDRPTGFLAAAVVSAVTLAFARGILGDTEVTTKIAVAGPRSRR
ncbi:MAG: MFS transporter, partial [Acidimicrobiales bacterium]